MTQTAALNIVERKRLDAFLQSIEHARAPSRYTYVIASCLAFIGLLLFVATTFITLNGLNGQSSEPASDIHVWMLLSGTVGATLIIATALLFLSSAKRTEDKIQLGMIVRKLLGEQPNSS